MSTGKNEKPFWSSTPEDGWIRVVHHHGRLGYICDPKVDVRGDTLWVCWKCKESLTPIEAMCLLGAR